ncbi:MAG: AAA family ATPase [Candidatus Aminicenantes bacterium]|nr:AAA family ATPase [Candidatus Aminicenantes bacterium]
MNKGTYNNGGEHLADELIKLDIRLHLQVLALREAAGAGGRGAEPQDSPGAHLFRGLYISEEDIDRVTARVSRDIPKENENPSTSLEKNSLPDQLKKHGETVSLKIENSLNAGIHLPLFHLSSIFHLNSIEREILIICLAPELDLKYEKLYAYLQDDVTLKQPTVNLALELLCGGSDNPAEEKTRARACFFDRSPLFKYRLLKFTGGDEQSPPGTLLSRRLKIDDRIANFLLGFNVMDSSLSSFTKLLEPTREWTSLVLEDDLKERLTRLAAEYFDNDFQRGDKKRLVFYLQGPYGAGKKSMAEALCRQLRLPLMVVDTGDFSQLNNDRNPAEAITRLFRETLLQPAAIYFEAFDRLSAPVQVQEEGGKAALFRKMIIGAVEEFSFLTFLAGEKEWQPQGSFQTLAFVKIRFPVPSYPLRKRLWEQLAPGINSDGMAAKFNFTGGQVRDAAAEATNLAMMHGGQGVAGVADEDLFRACRAQSNRKLSEMAQKIEPLYTWPDIVLPTDTMDQLKEIRNCLKYRHLVYGDWGFAKKISLGKGLNALFSGPSGTGKTMAAEVIAGEVGLELYKIDLSCVVSKYIGETEKNLAGIFKEAETANAILFFDEADALFGKRSEVKDSHDRYANIEIGYLLQRMEEYEGVTILATNMKNNMDEAFVRRMHFAVDFPFPDEDSRLRIWKNIFPAQTPVDKGIDFDFFSKNFNIPGGNIKNIALAAAFYAADDGLSVKTEHLILACKREFQKMGKLCLKSDFGDYYHLIQGQDSL